MGQESFNIFGTEIFGVDLFIEENDVSQNPLAITLFRAVGIMMYANGNNVTIGKFKANKYRGPKSACGPCQLRSQCLRNPDNPNGTRQVSYFLGRTEQGKNTFTKKMKRKIDSVVGRYFYSKRLGTVEPVFANICSTMGMNKFTLRGKKKVSSQWLMFCLAPQGHFRWAFTILKKIHQFGPGYA